MEIAADITVDIAIDIASRMELEAQVEMRQPEELKVFNSLRLSIVLLLAVYYQDSLKS